MSKKEKKKVRRICIKCGKKRFVENMIVVGKGYGSYYQAGREFETYQCKPSALDPKKCR